MKKALIPILLIITGCYTLAPVSTMNNYQLQQEYLDVQYKLEKAENDYLTSQIRITPPPPRIESYTTTVNAYNYGNSTYLQTTTKPNYDYSQSYVAGVYNLIATMAEVASKSNIKRLQTRLNELNTEMTIRGVWP